MRSKSKHQCTCLIIDHLYEQKLTLINVCFNRMVVFQICNEMVETVRLCGPGIIAERKYRVLAVIQAVIVVLVEVSCI